MNKNDEIIHDLAERLHAIDPCSIEQATKSFIKNISDWKLCFCNVDELRHNTNNDQVIGYFNDNHLVCGLNQLTSTWDYLESDINIIYCMIAQIRYNKRETSQRFQLIKDSDTYRIAVEIVKQFYDLRFNEFLNSWKNIDHYMERS